MNIGEIYEKTVKIIRCDGSLCRVRVRNYAWGASYTVFEVSELPAICRADYIFKRYPVGDYYWIDCPYSASERVRIRDLFPAWDLRKILAAHENEVIC